MTKGRELTHVFFSFLSFSCFLSLFLFLLLLPPFFLTFPYGASVLPTLIVGFSENAA